MYCAGQKVRLDYCTTGIECRNVVVAIL
jgi:hypothetical protein